jgi:hypothetical protein
MSRGTITAINGSRLTLRTENGTETVETNSSTVYTKELRTIRFSDLHVGDVVSVRPTPPSGQNAASRPPAPGTGTVEASAVQVIEPTFMGRVVSQSSGGYTLVGPDGQLLTVRTTAGTRFYNGTATASASSVRIGDHVAAEGTRTGISSLTADLIDVLPAPGARPFGPLRR